MISLLCKDGIIKLQRNVGRQTQLKLVGIQAIPKQQFGLNDPVLRRYQLLPDQRNLQLRYIANSLKFPVLVVITSK